MDRLRRRPAGNDRREGVRVCYALDGGEEIEIIEMSAMVVRCDGDVVGKGYGGDGV